MERYKIIIFGANGMLGNAVRKILKKHLLYLFRKSDADITDQNSVSKKISDIQPDFVINCAGFTDVDGSESKKEPAFKVNGKAVGIMAKSCRKNHAVMIHISTDYVFDGKKRAYKEDDKTNPINEYGKSKEAGEKFLIRNVNDYYLIRTSWLFGEKGKNFVSTILKLARSNSKLKVVNDQHGCPTYTKDLAISIKLLIEGKKPYGIYHLTNKGYCTWYQFAKKIVKMAGLKNKVMPIKSEELGRPAKRPKYSVLINTKMPQLRNWQIALKEYMGG